MAFRSKRLRVQLPCSDPGTLVDVPAADEPGCRAPSVCLFVGTAPPPPPTGCCLSLTSLDLCQTQYGTPPCLNAATRPPHCHYFDSQCNLFATPDCGASGGGCYFPTGACQGFDTGTGCYAASVLVCRAVELTPEQLPLLRRRLEEQLEQIETEQRRAKERVEAQLEEIEAAEAALAERDAGEGDET